MFCIGCGKQIESTSKFCPYCGADVREALEPGTQGAQKAQTEQVDQNEQTLLIEMPPDGVNVADYFSEKNDEAAVRRSEQNKKGNRIVLLAAIIAAVCVFAFLLFIGPKLLGVQFLPIDPFGLSESTAKTDPVEIDYSISSDDGDEPSANAEIKSIQISGGEIVGTIKKTTLAQEPSQDTVYGILVGDRIDLNAKIEPLMAEDMTETEW